MRRTVMLLLSALLAFGALIPRLSPAVAAPNDDMYAAINAYRQGLGLTAIPLSPELTAVARAHVQDLIANAVTDPNYTGPGCVPHSWSSQGQWTGGCYKFEDPTTFPIMWNKPKEIANYPGSGFEILYGDGQSAVTADAALKAWQADPPHNDVIVNQGIWQSHPWQAMGVWMESGWASVWFGEEVDPNATQPANAQTAQPAANNTNAEATTPTVTGTTGNAPSAGNVAAAQTTTATCADAEESRFLQLINDYRAQNGLQPLAFSQTLSVAADNHTIDMVTNDVFSHTGTDGSSWVDRTRAAGYPDPSTTGENIYAGNEAAQAAFDWFRNDPPHNAVMLDPNYKAIGISRVNGPNTTFKWYWTTDFGATADAAACTGAAAALVIQGPGQPTPAATAPAAAELPTAIPTARPQLAIEQPTTATTAAAATATATTATTAAAAALTCPDGEELAFVQALNDLRAQSGLPPLAISSTLTAAADAQAANMAANNLTSDVGSDGTTIGARVTNAGYPNPAGIGDIYSFGNETGKATLDSLKGVASLNSILLSPGFVAIGVARGDNPNAPFRWYWMIVLGNTADPATCPAAAAAIDSPAPTAAPTETAVVPATATETPVADTGNAAVDTDGDGLSDQDETTIYGTDPNAFDTDQGGTGDGAEIANGTNPLDPSDDAGNAQTQDVDTDGDGLPDAFEAQIGTDPNVADTDGDGVSDGDEVAAGTDPLDPNSF